MLTGSGLQLAFAHRCSRGPDHMQNDPRAHEGNERNSRRAWYERHMKGRFEPVNTVKAVAMIIRNLFFFHDSEAKTI